jgi:hypothetical protein
MEPVTVTVILLGRTWRFTPDQVPNINCLVALAIYDAYLKAGYSVMESYERTAADTSVHINTVRYYVENRNGVQQKRGPKARSDRQRYEQHEVLKATDHMGAADC